MSPQTLPQDIVDSICSSLGVPAELIYSKRRFDELVKARHLIALVLHNEHGWSTARLGWALDKDRTTINNSLLKAQDLIDTDVRYKRLYLSLTTRG